jgi:hypothetical protein
MDKHSSLPNTFPNQRVSNKEKGKEEFYIQCTNYIIDKAISQNNKAETIENLNMGNSILSMDSIKYLTEPYAKDKGKNDTFRFPDTLREIDLITRIKERYIGEFIRQYHNYQVYIHNPDVIAKRNKEVGEFVYNFLINKFAELVKNKTNPEEIENIDVETEVSKYLAGWTDDRITEGQKKLDLINSVTDSVVSYIKGYFHWFCTEEVYSYRDIRFNDLHKEIVSPLEYYRVDSGNIFVEDDHMGMRKYRLSISDVIDQFRDRLSEKDINYLRTLEEKSRYGEDIDLPVSLILDRKAFDLYSDPKNPISSLSIKVPKQGIDVYHCVWKTETKIAIVKYIDPITQEINEVELPGDYKLNPAEGDISLTHDYINEVAETYRFGGKIDGVYIPFKILEVQRSKLRNSSVCKLPYNGLRGLIPGNIIKPVPRRIAPYQLLLVLYYLQRERAIAKFKAINLIPESILQDSEHMTMSQRLRYSTLDDLLPYNDEDIEPSLLQGIKNLYNSGAERYIQILNEVIDSVKREAMDVANMNEQRYGDIAQRAGKAITEYAITKATTGSIWMNEMFNKFREKDYEADLDYSKVAWIEGKQGSFVNPQGDVVYVDFDGISQLGVDLGVKVNNSVIEDEKLEAFRNLAFSASQNGDLDIAADAIESNNAREIKRLIKKGVEARRQYETQTNQAAQMAQVEAENIRKEIETTRLAANKEDTLIKEKWATLRKLIEVEGKMKQENMKIEGIENQEALDETYAELEKLNVELEEKNNMLQESMKSISQNKQKEQ